MKAILLTTQEQLYSKTKCFQGSEYLMAIYQNNKKSKIPLYTLNDDRSQVIKFLNNLISKPCLRNITQASLHSCLKLAVQIDSSFI